MSIQRPCHSARTSRAPERYRRQRESDRDLRRVEPRPRARAACGSSDRRTDRASSRVSIRCSSTITAAEPSSVRASRRFAKPAAMPRIYSNSVPWRITPYGTPMRRRRLSATYDAGLRLPHQVNNALCTRVQMRWRAVTMQTIPENCGVVPARSACDPVAPFAARRSPRRQAPAPAARAARHRRSAAQAGTSSWQCHHTAAESSKSATGASSLYVWQYVE